MARDGQITPTASLPLAYSLYYLISHTQPDPADDAPGLSTAVLFSDLRRWVPDSAPRIHNIDPVSFARHAKRWAEANSILTSPLAGEPEGVSALHGVKFRDKPLGRDAAAAFIEGMAMGARS